MTHRRIQRGAACLVFLGLWLTVLPGRPNGPACGSEPGAGHRAGPRRPGGPIPSRAGAPSFSWLPPGWWTGPERPVPGGALFLAGPMGPRGLWRAKAGSGVAVAIHIPPGWGAAGPAAGVVNPLAPAWRLAFAPYGLAPARLASDAWSDWSPDTALQGVGVLRRLATFQELLPRLRSIFRDEGVPDQWVWMAEVESTGNSRALSRAGAAGLFQLMPATAERFGLRMDGGADERFDPERNARAAARYLRILHRQFGCWNLALAAYNAGEGRVRAVLRQTDARTFEEAACHLPAETRAYVPRVTAIAALRERQRGTGAPSVR